LALWQARRVQQALREVWGGVASELLVVSTRGDQIVDRALDQIPGKGLFTKEVEDAILAGRADLAVHSLKDLPTEPVAGLALPAILEREDPADALISKGRKRLDQLPRGARVMTGSLRREAQIRHIRPDVQILPVRGNVPTRVQKFQQSDADAIVLARAGLLRLELADLAAQRLEPDDFLPACGQGALAVETRSDNAEIIDICQRLDDEPTRLAVAAERAFLAAMGGGCQAPLGAFGRFRPGDSSLTLTAMAASHDGGKLVRRSLSGSVEGEHAAAMLGCRLAQTIKAEGIQEVLDLLQHQPKLSDENP